MVENKEVFYEQGKLQHSRQDEESSQDNWGHTGRRHQEDKWSLRSCYREERHYEDQTRDKVCKKAIKTITNKDLSKKGNNDKSKKQCHSAHRDHIDSLCPLSKKALEGPKNWSEEFDILKTAQNKRFEENKRKAQVIQKKLLALAGDYQVDDDEDPQLKRSSTRKERKSRPASGGNAAEGKMIDLATSEEETEASIQDTNLVASPPKEK